MQKEQLGGYFLGSGIFNFLSLLESLAKAKTSKSSSALQSMRKQFFDTNVIVAHQDYPCQIWHDPPTATTTQKYTLHTLCIWGWVVDMVNNNVDRNYSKFKYLPHLRL